MPSATPRGARPRSRLTAERLAWVHPARIEIEFDSPFALLVAVVLSAQSTDRMANQLTPRLLAVYRDAEALAGADPAEVERILRPIGFFRAKTRALIRVSQALLARHGGRVPRTLPELVALPGIGRKSANAILAAGFAQPGIITDRHLIRVAGRLRLVSRLDPPVVEAELRSLLPRAAWTPFSFRVTLHGRYVCVARRPRCEDCVLNDFCPSSSTRGWPLPSRRLRVEELRAAAGG